MYELFNAIDGQIILAKNQNGIIAMASSFYGIVILHAPAYFETLLPTFVTETLDNIRKLHH